MQRNNEIKNVAGQKAEVGQEQAWEKEKKKEISDKSREISSIAQFS